MSIYLPGEQVHEQGTVVWGITLRREIGCGSNLAALKNLEIRSHCLFEES